MSGSRPFPDIAPQDQDVRFTSPGWTAHVWISAEAACRHWERYYIRLMAVSSPDLKSFLVSTPFFGGLADASLDLLVSMLVERRFDVGATVVSEGEPGAQCILFAPASWR